MVNEYQIKAMRKNGLKPLKTPDADEDDDQESTKRIESYIGGLSYVQRKQAIKAVDTCLTFGDSMCAIDYMLSEKPEDNWSEYGYGLLFNSTFRENCRKGMEG